MQLIIKGESDTIVTKVKVIVKDLVPYTRLGSVPPMQQPSFSHGARCSAIASSGPARLRHTSTVQHLLGMVNCIQSRLVLRRVSHCGNTQAH